MTQVTVNQESVVKYADLYSSAFLDKHRLINTSDSHWSESTLNEFLTVLSTLGFQVEEDDIRFSGFSCQGDGASFKGKWSSSAFDEAAFKALAGTAYSSTEQPSGELATYLKAIELIKAVLSEAKTSIDVKISNSGHYCHSNMMRIDQIWYGDDDQESEEQFDAEDDLLEIFKMLADALYKSLNTEYDVMQSDEEVANTLYINEIWECDTTTAFTHISYESDYSKRIPCEVNLTQRTVTFDQEYSADLADAKVVYLTANGNTNRFDASVRLFAEKYDNSLVYKLSAHAVNLLGCYKLD